MTSHKAVCLIPIGFYSMWAMKGSKVLALSSRHTAATFNLAWLKAKYGELC